MPNDRGFESNVEDLKGVWTTDLRGSGAAAKYSSEAQPIVYEGVIYVPTGEDHVFAVSVETRRHPVGVRGKPCGAGLARVGPRDGDVGDREPPLWSVVIAVCGGVRCSCERNRERRNNDGGCCGARFADGTEFSPRNQLLFRVGNRRYSTRVFSLGFTTDLLLTDNAL